MNRAKWVFFDLGWTLFDETQSHLARLNVATPFLRDPESKGNVDDLMRACEVAATDFNPSPFFGMLSGLGLSKEQQEHIRAVAPYDHSHEVCYPGVHEILTALSGHYRLGVIANQSKGSEERLQTLGIRHHFSAVIASAELGTSKPDERIFAAALSEAQCSPVEAVMVGDRLDNDIGPAKAQGWKTVRVLQGFSRFQTPRSSNEEADITIATIGQLSAHHLDSLAGSGQVLSKKLQPPPKRKQGSL